MLKKGKVILILKILAVIVGVFILASWLALPDLLKDYIETNDKEWANREITIQEINFNPLTFTLDFNDFNIAEPDSEEIFLHVDTLLINLDFWPLLLAKIQTQEITFTNLSGRITKNGNQFNFSDLLVVNEEDVKEEAAPTIAFNLNNIQILKSRIQYTDMVFGNTIILDSIAIKDHSFTSADTLFDAEFAFHQPEGSWIKGALAYNVANIKSKSDEYKKSIRRR